MRTGGERAAESREKKSQKACDKSGLAAPPSESGQRRGARDCKEARSDHVYLIPGFLGFGSLGALSYFRRVLELLKQRFAERGLGNVIQEGGSVHRARRGCAKKARNKDRDPFGLIPPVSTSSEWLSEQSSRDRGIIVNGQTILDADGHVIERDAELFEYLTAPYAGNDTVLGHPFFPTPDGYQRGAIMSRLGIHKKYTINASTWIAFLDQVGIERTVLYPTAGLTCGFIQDPEWAVAVTRAYNDWFHDRFHRVSPRLRAMALVPLQDVGEAVKELRRAVTELGAAGVVLTANNGELGVRHGLGHPSFWPLYAEAERLDVPVAIHSAPSMNLGINFFTKFALTQALEHPIAQMIQLTSLVMEGVFEHFPKLRVAFLEAGTGWVPYMMDRLDRGYEVWSSSEYREFSAQLTKKPSEYIASGRIYFSGEGGEASLPYFIERLGHRTLLFASDFPHETNVERAKHELHELLTHPHLTDEAKQCIVHDNVVRFYGER